MTSNIHDQMIAAQKECKCSRCGREMPLDNFIKRYNEMNERGIVPMMILVCEDCLRGLTNRNDSEDTKH